MFVQQISHLKVILEVFNKFFNFKVILNLFLDKIWTPDTCIINSKDSSIHSSPSENTFVILYEHGLVWSNFRFF